MKILVLNCGSSSVKYGLFKVDKTSAEVLLKGAIERIASDSSQLVQEWREGCRIINDDIKISSHRDAIEIILESLKRPDYGTSAELVEIEAVGHRIVHGGNRFSGSILIDQEVISALRDYSALAPLHNPFNIMGIETVTSLLPNAPQIAVFDTAFHQTMPPRAFIYALPYQLYEEHCIRRYGFHGISHRYVAEEAASILGRPLQELKLVSCHLGSGASVAAIKFGQSIDTSMGFSPLEGLVMGTRCGDLDPSIVAFLIEKEGLNVLEIHELLNNKSGLLGLSGYTWDMQEIEELAAFDGKESCVNEDSGDPHRARLALDIFCYRLKKYIGAYAAAMGGIDGLLFTGGIGERSTAVPERACSELDFLGISLGPRSGLGRGRYELSRQESKVRILVIPTDEQLMIARDAYQVVRGITHGNCPKSHDHI